MFEGLHKHINEIVPIEESEFGEFKGIPTPIKLRKKEILISPGTAVDMEYYVVKGCLKAYHTNEGGHRSVVQFAIEDWWISDFNAFFNKIPAKLTIEAIEDSTLLGLKLENLEELYGRIPKFERFFRVKTTRAFLSLTNRIQSGLEKDSRERYIEFCKTYPNIEQRVANYHIASYLGIKPESLSRIRRELVTINTP